MAKTKKELTLWYATRFNVALSVARSKNWEQLLGAWEREINTTTTRQDRGENIASKAASNIEKVSANTYLVLSQSKHNTQYIVNLQNNSCSCPDYAFRQLQCKHIIAVKEIAALDVILDSTTEIAPIKTFTVQKHPKPMQHQL